jgi:ATP-dependent helicase/nuclease subunit B
VRCPYHYFLKYLLHIDVPDEHEDDLSSWLNPLDFGSLLHELLCDFMQGLKTSAELPQIKHLAAMKKLVQEKAEKKRKSTPVTHEAAYRADIERLEQAAEIFLHAEAGQKNTQPVGFEVSFGFGRKGELDSPEPVLLQLTKDITLKLRGRIDRVDKVTDGYAIWDYKSGSAYSYKEASLNHAGSYLQWALYAYVLDEILKKDARAGRVVQSGYFFTTEREYGKRIAPQLPTRHELGDRLQPLFELVADGCFFHIQKEDHCKFCEYSRVCATEGITSKKWKSMAKESGTQGAAEEKISRWLNG